MSDVNGIYNFLKLEDRIGTSGQPTEEQLGYISDAGYEIVINLALTGTEYALEDEAGLVQDLGMDYVHLPVIWQDPTPVDFERFVEVLNIFQEKKIFVHCAANMRVSVFMALYRILLKDWEREAALSEVHKIWEPNDTWSAFMDLMLSGGSKEEGN